MPKKIQSKCNTDNNFTDGLTQSWFFNLVVCLFYILLPGNASRDCQLSGFWSDKTDYSDCREVGEDDLTEVSIVIYAVGKVLSNYYGELTLLLRIFSLFCCSSGWGCNPSLI